MPEQFISLEEVSRRLNVNRVRVLQLHSAGCFDHDAEVNHTYLFREGTLNEIKAKIDAWGLPRAVKANAERQRKFPVTGKNIH